MQTPREQPDLAAEAWREARPEAGADFPEAEGGHMEVS